MSFSKVHSAQVHLLKAYKIDVEIDLSRGLNNFTIVGLPDKAVAESKDRVSAAIKNSGYESPKSKNQKVVVSLAPADIRKEGPNFDVAIALAYLLATKDVSFNPDDKIFLGELSLDGTINCIKGALPLVLEAKRLGFKEIYLPLSNVKEAHIISGISIFGITQLNHLISHLEGDYQSKKPQHILLPAKIEPISYKKQENYVDFKNIKGQNHAKRALEISASGGHNILLYGPPGTGKTMLAKAFPYILPKLSFDEIIETTSIHSSYTSASSGLVVYPPFRTPHHTSSHLSLIGGGAYLKPGEITLAHKGVLFMDEFSEFDSKSLEALRQPLEEKEIHLSRARSSTIFPADFILIATMNPCPCGYKGSKKKECICSFSDILKYKRKLSGPIVDRIDLFVGVNEVEYEKLGTDSESESSQDIAARVFASRSIQKSRLSTTHLKLRTNSEIPPEFVIKIARLAKESLSLLNEHSKKITISARSYHRTIKVARTIADLKNKNEIEPEDILEAIQYRFRMD